MIDAAVDIKMPDGICDAVVYRPDDKGAWPGILMLPDIMGPRPAFHGMAERLAGHGYVVLLPNFYYRDKRLPLFDHIPDTRSDDDRTKLRAMGEKLTQPVLASDAAALVDWMASQPYVKGKIGVVGYCMTGSMAMQAAAMRPDKVAAAASFHGTRLASDAPDSPHTQLPKIKARLYFGHAIEDGSCPPEMILKLEAAAKEAGVNFENVTYQALHGFAVYGARAYDQAASEQHWKAITKLFKETLK